MLQYKSATQAKLNSNSLADTIFIGQATLFLSSSVVLRLHVVASAEQIHSLVLQNILEIFE
jgi:phosphoglucomutase